MAHHRTRFSANLNKFALIRNARGANKPELVTIARRCLDAGVDGITVHPRVDQRHARYDDVADLKAIVLRYPGAELNVEGAIDERLLDVVLAVRPDQCTLVPDAPEQLTSDHGWDVPAHDAELRAVIGRLHGAGVRVSLFLDPVAAEVQAARDVGADRIELYTQSYATAFESGAHALAGVIGGFRDTAIAAQRAGLGVNAGHDLNLDNLGYFIGEVPGVLEVSIGHAFICEAFDHGLEGTVARYRTIVGA